MRPRIFDLPGNNFVGRMSTRSVKSGAWVVRQSNWGSWGTLNGSHWGLIVGNLTSLGNKVLEYSGSAREMYFRVFGLHWGSGVWRLDSDGNFET